MKAHNRVYPTVLLLAGCLLIQTVSLARQGGLMKEEEAQHHKWLLARLVEAQSVKVGMTREELLKFWEPDGGRQFVLPRRYILRSCSMIKVNVEFELPKGVSERDLAQGTQLLGLATGERLPINSQIKITSISKPYLEPMTMD